MSALVTVCERIVQNHQHEEYDGYLIDATTANVIVTVAAALSPANRARIDSVPLPRFVAFCLNHVK
jgi:hypothetical protein